MPVEIMLLPRWFSVSLDEDFLLGPHRARAAAGAAGAQAAGAQPARRAHRRAVHRAARRNRRRPQGAAPEPAGGSRFSRCVDSVLQTAEPLFPAATRAARDRRTRSRFVTERLNGEDGLGAIFPAMANAVMMFDVLGYPRGPSRPRDGARGRSTSSSSSRQTRPIASPASRRCGIPRSPPMRCWRPAPARMPIARASAGWNGCCRLQVLDVKGDWAFTRPGRAPGRLGVPVRQSALSRSRRHRRRRDGDGPRAQQDRGTAEFDRRSRAAANGSRACKAATAAGAPSTPTTRTNTSTTSRSPTTARCSIRRRADVTGALRRRCSPSSATRHRTAAGIARASIICAATRWPMAAGTAAGA